jgi:UDP-N-acetylglucosamine 1-carboxyvinyltransferase
MGAELSVVHGFIEAHCSRLCGARIVLDFPSVGATENLLTAAVLAKGTTVIDNAAREPEIADLAAFLDRMGAHVVGAGTSTIEIDGVDELQGADSEIMADRVEAGTLLIACGIAGGEIELVGTRMEHLEVVVMKLGEMGMRVSPTPEGLWARCDTRLTAVDIATLPHPGFATDFMPLAVALLAVADGSAIVTENVYDGRFQFVDELARMGADIRTEGRHAIVRGVERLSGAPVSASDVRAGAALTVAGLAADGETVVHECQHVDRGYADLPAKLRALGADVHRI